MSPATGHRTVRRRPGDWDDVDTVLRVGLGAALVLMMGSVGQIIVGLTGGPPMVGFAGGALIGVLTALIRTGTPLSATAVGMAMVTAFLHIRAGAVATSMFTGSQGVLALAVLVVVVLVVADRVGTDMAPPIRGTEPVPPRRGLTVSSVAAALAVLAIIFVAAPFVVPVISRPVSLGEGPRLEVDGDGAGPVLASDRLDMTDRPDLTDKVVFTVDADRATFWRGQIFDQWDGRTWTQSQPRRFAATPEGELAHDRFDLGATGDDVLVQRFRLEAGYSDVVFAAASAVSVDAASQVVQTADGSVFTGAEAFGRGATYTAVSRRRPLTEEVLRAADGPIPEEVTLRYAADPETTPRVRDAALAATEGFTSNYDKVRALERWMDRTTRYSLDAALSPKGVDVVDHFLFTAREGWCEQVASSLVVMARVNGIPARLVTGYVPGEAKPLTGTYVVRERDAHAWAEVWFPDLGWVPFDPTASVPLAGADRAEPAAGQWLVEHGVQVLVGLAAVGLAGWSVFHLVRRTVAARRSRPQGWAAVTESRLEEWGRSTGQPRADAQTATAYAALLAARVGDPRVADVGRAVDDALYAPVGPDASTRQRVDALLEEVSIDR
jgi:transglutaminase-like putative cysteine protease